MQLKLSHAVSETLHSEPCHGVSSCASKNKRRKDFCSDSDTDSDDPKDKKKRKKKKRKMSAFEKKTIRIE